MTEKTTSINSILLDVENPRIDPVELQREAIQRLLNNPGISKFFKLARDIMEYGLNPTESIICVPATSPQGKTLYIAKEGNRRLLALKAIAKPEILKEKRLKNRMKQMLRTFGGAPLAPKRIPIVVFDEDERDLMNHWIKNKHDGVNGGAGTVPWGSLEKSRFAHKGTRRDLTRIVVEWLKNSSSLAEHARNQLEEVPVTTLERIIMSCPGQEIIGIKSMDGKVMATRDLNKTQSILMSIVSELTTPKEGDPRRKQLNVSDVKNKEKIENYLQKFRALSGAELTAPAILGPDDYPDTESIISGKTNSAKASTISGTKKAKRTLAEWLLSIQAISLNNKIGTIAKELSLLNVKKTPLMFCIGFRSLLELSMRIYATKHSIPQTKTPEKAKSNAELAADCKNELMKDPEWKQTPYKGLIAAGEDTLNHRGVFSITELNQLVHGTLQMPSTEIILTYCPRLIPFLIALNGGHPSDVV